MSANNEKNVCSICPDPGHLLPGDQRRQTRVLRSCSLCYGKCGECQSGPCSAGAAPGQCRHPAGAVTPQTHLQPLRRPDRLQQIGRRYARSGPLAFRQGPRQQVSPGEYERHPEAGRAVQVRVTVCRSLGESIVAVLQ